MHVEPNSDCIILLHNSAVSIHVANLRLSVRCHVCVITMGRSLCFRTLFCVATSWELIFLSILQSTDQFTTNFSVGMIKQYAVPLVPLSVVP
ncbi:hypothetical protein BDE02_10G161400 [Populus trichocarpa]|nr:hypothetical protein BDE02_10G161400 [Populus trichocarpa]